jgi:hypothetical protein
VEQVGDAPENVALVRSQVAVGVRHPPHVLDHLQLLGHREALVDARGEREQVGGAARLCIGELGEANRLVVGQVELVAQRRLHGFALAGVKAGVGAHHLDQHHRGGELERVLGGLGRCRGRGGQKPVVEVAQGLEHRHRS